MVASDMQHFVTLMKKNLLIEMDSKSKYYWNIGIILFLGLIFGMAASQVANMAYVLFIVSIFTFLQCGFVGKMIATNLIRDRNIKFRLTLQLVGVKQSVYMASNIVFAILYGIIQILLLLVSIFLFSVLFGIGNRPVSNNENDLVKLDASMFFTFLSSAILFLLAYLAMCAAFSGLISQYEFSSEIIGKFTFITIFVPIAFVVSSFISAITDANEDNIGRVGRVNWAFIWLPNMTFLNQGASVVIAKVNVSVGKNILNIDPSYYFTAVMIAQFVGYLIIYFFIDRFISTDTGGQRKLIGNADSKLLEDIGTTDVDSSRHNLLGVPQMIETSIKIRKLSKKFGDFTALNNVNVDIVSNNITCLLGHNGAGKTTLIDIMTGFQSPTEGGVYLNGSNIHTNSDILYGKVGYASSHDPLFEEMIVKDFLIMLANLKGCPNPEQEAMKVISETNLQPHAGKKVRECSGGTKRRVSISSSLIGDPQLIFLDEPSTGVDPENRRALWDAIALMKRSDRIILLTTHYLEEAEFLSKDVIILTKGQVTVRGTPDGIKQELKVGYKFNLSGLGLSTKESLYQSLNQYLPYMNINEDRLQSVGEIEFALKQAAPELVMGVLNVLNQTGFKYSIYASTLEDAFIKLGEAEETLELVQKREEIINSIFQLKFNTSYGKRFVALLLRKFFLLFRSMLQFMIILLLIAVPCGTYYLVASFAFGANNKWKTDSSQPVRYLAIGTMGILNILCIVYYSFSCGFFGIIPVVERLGRIRYLMKMNNVNWMSYYPTLLIPDIIIAIFLIVTTYAISYLLTYKLYGVFNMEVFCILGLNLFIWMMTFIVQSYCVSFLFSTKEKAVKHLTNLLLLLNLGIGFILSYIRGVVYNRGLRGLSDAIGNMNSILFPCFVNIEFAASHLTSDNLEINKLKTALFHSSICFVLFFSLAILLDYLDSRIKSSERIPMPREIAGEIFDPVGTENERQEAVSRTDQHPIQIAEVYKKFNANFYALRDVSLVLKQGEILGLIGPNGAGKSTLFNIVSNYLSPTAGDIKYNGKYLDQIPEFYEKTGLCAQDDIIWPELSVDQHLNFYAHLKGVNSDVLLKWKELMGLSGFGNFSSINLSTGMKRKLCYIISMMSNPKYKFLDEPTSGLDPVSRKLMRKLIIAQKRIYGGSCVFTTHTMKDAEDLCDRVAVLVNGRLTCIDTVNNLRTKTGGINVSLIRNLATTDYEAEEKYLAGVFTQVFPESLEAGLPVITDRTERKIVFFAPNLTERDVIGKMSALYEMKSRGTIVDFEISQRSLEDLFLYLARYQQRRALV